MRFPSDESRRINVDRSDSYEWKNYGDYETNGGSQKEIPDDSGGINSVVRFIHDHFYSNIPYL